MEDNVYKIDIKTLKENQSKLENLISPAKEVVEEQIYASREAEPIKSIEDIYMITEFLKAKHRYRDNMIFIIGINFGLRVSDLRMLRFSNLINDNFTFKDTFPVFEKKTRNTRKRKKNRYITINNAVKEAVMLYLENTEGVSLSDFLFRSEATNSGGCNEPLTNRSIDRILKGISNDLGLNCKVSTHTLRKTFCYHQMVKSNNDNRKLLLLSKMLGHATVSQTLDYIGITADEMHEAYKNFNLGGSSEMENIINSNVLEEYEVPNYGLS